MALVRSNLDPGSLILAGPDGDVTLVWTDGEKGDTRAVSAGEYRLRTTRIERTKGGEHWFLSSTGPKQEAKSLRAGRTTQIDVADTVHFRGRIQRHPKQEGRLQLGFSIQAADGRGLSVYKDDKRVPVTYEVLSGGGDVLASGTMNYG